MSAQIPAISGNTITIGVDNLPEGYFLLKTYVDGEISINKFLKK